MSKRLRRLIAVGMAFGGLGALTYYYYALTVLRAYVHLFESLRMGPVEQSQTELGRLVPFVGWVLLAGSAALLVGPELRQRFRRSRRAV